MTFIQSILASKYGPWGLCVLAGVMGSLAFVGFDQFYLAWIFLIPLLLVISNVSPKKAFVLGWVGGMVGNLGGFYWIIHTLVTFAHVNYFIALLGLVILALVNALSTALFAYLLRYINLSMKLSIGFVAPVIWTFIEFLFPNLFPFYIGASQYLVPILCQISDITSILGVSFLVIFSNGVVYELISWLLKRRDFPQNQCLALGLILLLVFTYGFFRLENINRQVAEADKIKVGLVQVNMGAAEKHKDRQGFLRAHQQMSDQFLKQEQVDLLVWPEGAYGYLIEDTVTKLPSSVLGGIRVPTLFGSMTRTGKGKASRKYNSAIISNSQQQITGRYLKRVLVPFSEYIPLGATFPIIYEWSPYAGHFSSGSSFEPLEFGEYLLSINICYEDLFPDLIKDFMIGVGSQAHKTLPHAMFNLTNDSWFGDTHEPLQHLILASFRSIEQRRSIVRSTNTGISSIIDPTGNTDKRLGQNTKGVLVGDVPMLTSRTIYSYIGDAFGWLISTVALLFVGQSYWIRRNKIMLFDLKSVNNDVR